MNEDGQPQVEYVTDLTLTHQGSILDQHLILQSTLEGALDHFSKHSNSRLRAQGSATEQDELGSTSNFNQIYQASYGNQDAR